MPDLGQDLAQTWIERWDRQQESYLAEREDRCTALIDAVEEGTGRADPLILDLGCGPGSLAVRLLDRLPAATVIAVDIDPVLLALGRAAYSARPGLRFADVDLGVRGWSAALGLDRPADAAVSTTALHWLDEPKLSALYAELAAALRPGGLLLDGDHLRVDETGSPTLARLERAVTEREERRRNPDGHGENWTHWWEAVLADPALAGPVTQRASRRGSADHHGSESGLLSTHVRALRAAGFAEIGTLWQRGENRVLCAVLGG